MSKKAGPGKKKKSTSTSKKKATLKKITKTVSSIKKPNRGTVIKPQMGFMAKKKKK